MRLVSYTLQWCRNRCVASLPYPLSIFLCDPLPCSCSDVLFLMTPASPETSSTCSCSFDLPQVVRPTCLTHKLKCAVGMQGAAGIPAPYREACSWMQMTGRIRMASVLARMPSMAPAFTSEGPSQQYTVLLVVLAGLPDDAGQLHEAVSQVAHLPLLIVVIGLGSADFSSLQVCPWQALVLTVPCCMPGKSPCRANVVVRLLRPVCPASSSACLAQAPELLMLGSSPGLACTCMLLCTAAHGRGWALLCQVWFAQCVLLNIFMPLGKRKHTHSATLCQVSKSCDMGMTRRQ